MLLHHFAAVAHNQLTPNSGIRGPERSMAPEWSSNLRATGSSAPSTCTMTSTTAIRRVAAGSLWPPVHQLPSSNAESQGKIARDSHLEVWASTLAESG